MTFASAIDIGAGIDLAEILRLVIAKHQAKHATVARECGMDVATFSRMLAGLLPMDLWRLRLMDPRMLVDFLTGVAIAAVNKHFNEIQLPLLRMAKAQLPESDRKEKVSA